MNLKMSSAKWRPYGPGFIVLNKAVITRYLHNTDTWLMSLAWIAVKHTWHQCVRCSISLFLSIIEIARVWRINRQIFISHLRWHTLEFILISIWAIEIEIHLVLQMGSSWHFRGASFNGSGFYFDNQITHHCHSILKTHNMNRCVLLTIVVFCDNTQWQLELMRSYFLIFPHASVTKLL